MIAQHCHLVVVHTVCCMCLLKPNTVTKGLWSVMESPPRSKFLSKISGQLSTSSRYIARSRKSPQELAQDLAKFKMAVLMVQVLEGLGQDLEDFLKFLGKNALDLAKRS